MKDNALTTGVRCRPEWPSWNTVGTPRFSTRNRLRSDQTGTHGDPGVKSPLTDAHRGIKTSRSS